MPLSLPVVPESYDPATVELCSFYDAVPGFLEGSDTPRAYLERCLDVIAVAGTQYQGLCGDGC